jgi:hypothetical protein
MNQLVRELVKGLFEQEKPKVVALYGGGFKPPTKGHFGVVKQTLKEYPEIDELIIYVGSGVRDGITQFQSLKVWEIYVKHLPSKVKIEPVTSPVKAILDYPKDHPENKVLWVLGAREGDEEDIKDITSRTKSISKYPNLEVKVITRPGGVSGTKTRKSLMSGDKEAFFQYIPDIPEKEQIWDMLSQTLNEEYSPSSEEAWDLQKGIVSLTRYMKDNGLNISLLPKLKTISNDEGNANKLLGFTAYYNPGEKSITLYTLNRHPKDILRSYANEMIHHMQNLENRLGNINTTNTNEDGTLPDVEREAYEKGNMMLRNWEDSIKNPINEHILKFSYPRTLAENLWYTINEITLNPSNAVEIYGGLTNGKFQVGEVKYVYNISQAKNPYNDDGRFYNISFHPEGNITSTPQQGKENYIKILNTMYKIILDFAEEAEPEYIGISSMNNGSSKNYHNVYANLTDNKFNRIPGYSRKDVSLEFDTPNGKGRFVVLKRKD